MTNDNMNRVVVVQTKSNAPWILGLIGFLLMLPQMLCSILCASAAADLGEGGAALVFFLPVITAVACFVLGFMGKKSCSKATGILTIVLSFANVYACIANISYLGIVASVLFLCSGISSISNANKPASV